MRAWRLVGNRQGGSSMAGQAEQQQALTAGGDDDDRLRRLGRLVSYALEQDELWKMWWFLLYIPIGLGRMQFEVRIHKGEDEKQAVAEFHDLLSKAVLRAAVLAEYALEGSRTLTSGDDEEIADRTRYAKTFIIDTYLVKDPVERLRAYPGWDAARSARWAFLKAMRPAASWRRARWFSSFLHQRMRMPRFRFSQEWVASTTQRRARQPGVRALSLISSPRARMCGV